LRRNFAGEGALFIYVGSLVVGAAGIATALALSDYARLNDPFSKIGKSQISVEVSNLIRASDSSFRVEWIERRYVDGSLASTERWSAILTIVLQMPTDADRLKKNPLGVYIHALNWSKELS